ncbi:MAG: hypothetical protein JSS07_02260 [Proteobacteria bacterium]|nr:hypothetical protein [Pseudomonadota bacterium]
MTKQPQIPLKNPKLIIFLLLIVLAGPLFFAYILVQKGNAYQFRLSNNGDLITPPVNISKLTFFEIGEKKQFSGDKLSGKWWLLYASPAKCQQTCQDILYSLQQIRTALGKDALRLERIFLAHPHCQQSVCETFLLENYPDMARATLKPSNYTSLFANIGNLDARNTYGEVYIIDPKGNIMMHYDANMEPKAILSDLKRLLKISKIG